MTYTTNNSNVLSRFIAGSAICAALCTLSVPAFAGEITGYTPYPGINSVAGVAIVPAVAPNNDDVPGTSPNDMWVTQKDYRAISPVDIVFDVIPSGGTTEYAFREGVSNSTGLDWSGYTIQLGFGTGAGFVVSSAGDGLDFDSPDYNSPPDFTTFFSSAVTATEDTIVASGGLFPNGAFSIPYFTFSVDVPDSISSFTLRQVPIAVPEPTSLVALTLSLGGLLLRRRR